MHLICTKCYVRPFAIEDNTDGAGSGLYASATCGHIFCHSCLSEILLQNRGPRAKCPACDARLAKNNCTQVYPSLAEEPSDKDLKESVKQDCTVRAQIRMMDATRADLNHMKKKHNLWSREAGNRRNVAQLLLAQVRAAESQKDIVDEYAQFLRDELGRAREARLKLEEELRILSKTA